jgi:hypothetical protein
MKGLLTANVIKVGSASHGASFTLGLDGFATIADVVEAAQSFALHYAWFDSDINQSLMFVVNSTGLEKGGGGVAWQSVMAVEPMPADKLGQAWAVVLALLVPIALTTLQPQPAKPGLDGTPIANAPSSERRH